MTTARQKILTHLRKTRSATAREIARALNMAAPNVRHHLSVLCSDGRVDFVSVNSREQRGRPEKVYSLSEAALGDNLSLLAGALLTEAGADLNLESLAARMMNAESLDGLPISRRLALLIEKLNGMHYQARWEAGAEGPRVILGRCPYRNLAGAHTVLCRMDEAIVAAALDRPVIRLQKADAGGHGTCPFLFQTG